MSTELIQSITLTILAIHLWTLTYWIRGVGKKQVETLRQFARMEQQLQQVQQLVRRGGPECSN